MSTPHSSTQKQVELEPQVSRHLWYDANITDTKRAYVLSELITTRNKDDFKHGMTTLIMLHHIITELMT